MSGVLNSPVITRIDGWSADEYPDGITERGVGLVLGISERAARADIDQAMTRWRIRIPCEECGAEAGSPCDAPGGLHSTRGRDEIAAVLRTKGTVR